MKDPNHWCSECGVEITSGSICNECDPENGASHVTYTFTAFEPDQTRDTPTASEDARPWWKFW